MDNIASRLWCDSCSIAAGERLSSPDRLLRLSTASVARRGAFSAPRGSCGLPGTDGHGPWRVGRQHRLGPRPRTSSPPFPPAASPTGSAVLSPPADPAPCTRLTGPPSARAPSWGPDLCSGSRSAASTASRARGARTTCRAGHPVNQTEDTPDHAVCRSSIQAKKVWDAQSGRTQPDQMACSSPMASRCPESPRAPRRLGRP